MRTASPLVAVQDVCKQLLERNSKQVDAFAEVVEGYREYLLRTTSLQERLCTVERENVALLEVNRVTTERLKNAERTASKGLEALALEKEVATLKEELTRSYKNNADVAGQLIAASKDLHDAKAEIVSKDGNITSLKEQLEAAQSMVDYLKGQILEQEKALEVAVNDAAERREGCRLAEEKLQKVETENRSLIDRWMEQKMKDAERLNEVNAMYEDMLRRANAEHLEEVARRQVDGMVRATEAGDEALGDLIRARLPDKQRHTLRAHDGGCSALHFEHNRALLFSGGADKGIKIWETANGSMTSTLRGCLGLVLDLAVSSNNQLCLGASSDLKLYLWDVESTRVKHTLTGHTDKVCACTFSGAASKRAVSAAHDRTLKVWDLVTGYCVQTIMFPSNCNTCCVAEDNAVICSGHMDGHLRFWDLRSGVLANEVAGHGQAVTSVSLSKNGNTILSSGRDNLLHLVDVRNLQTRTTLRASGYRVATNWSRSCLSSDELHVASGSVDGSVYIWNVATSAVERTLKGHKAAVLACAWSELGKPLASADKNGAVHIWE